MMHRKWSKEAVIQELHACHRKCGDVRQVRHLDPNLYAAAKRYFGSWHHALSAGELEPPRRKWSQQAVILAIQARHKSGQTLTNVRKHDNRLAQAAKRYFGRWADALLAAGVRPEQPFLWTKEAVVEAIRQRYQSGVPLRISTPEDRSLYQGVLLCFGNWGSAMRAAGFEPCQMRWSKQRIIEVLRRRHPLPKSLWKDDRKLAGAVKRHFGGRHNALVAAGLAVSEPKDSVKWSKQRVVAEIRAWNEMGRPPLKREAASRQLHSASRQYFGSWTKALAAAGISLSRRRWNKQSVIDAIQDLHRRGIRLSTVWKEDPKLFSAARKHFGGWHEALVAAGFPSTRKNRPLRWSEQKVIAAIQQWHDRGLPLNKVCKTNKPLFRAAQRYFGGWHEALAAAGFETRRRRKWSKELVLEEIRERYLSTEPRIRRNDPGFVSVAAHYFGTWGKALNEAGVEPGRKWNRPRVIEAIQDRYVHGLQVHSVWRHDRKLAYAGKKHFGSWKAALAAAGLDGEYREPKAARFRTRQLVVEAIRALPQKGVPLTKIWNQDATLYSAAKRHFGSWRRAVLAAGLEMKWRQWSKRTVVDEIRSRWRQGLSLSSGCRNNSLLVAAAIRYFGSWRKAMHAARVDPDKVVKTRSRT